MKTLAAFLSTAFILLTLSAKAQEKAGYILAKEGQTILIDLGKGQLTIGERFEVYSPGKIYEHPVSGEKIQAESKVIATIEVTAVKDKYSEAKALSGSPDKIQKGQSIRKKIDAQVVSEKTMPLEEQKVVETKKTISPPVVKTDLEQQNEEEDAVAVKPVVQPLSDDSFTPYPKVISYKERESHVTGVMNRGSSDGFRASQQFSVHLLEKVEYQNDKKFRKSHFYYAGLSQILKAEETTSEMFITLHDANDISKLSMNNYVLPFYPIKRHNLLVMTGLSTPLFHNTYTFTRKVYFPLTVGYRMYVTPHIFAGFNLGLGYFMSIRPYAEIPIGYVLNPNTYKNTHVSVVFNLRLMNEPEYQADGFALPNLLQRNLRGFLKRDWLLPSFSLEFQNRNLVIQLPELCLNEFSWYNSDREIRPVVGFRVAYMLGFGSNINSPF